MDDIIRIDENFPDCTAIVTDVWLERVLGEPLELSDENGFGNFAPGQWLMQCVNTIKGMIEDHEGREYRVTEVQNTYNSENDFSDDFQFAVFYPADASDWVYADDVYVAVEPHLGGDPRGNYGNIRIYKSGDLVDGGFFDWCLGWTVNYIDDGASVPEVERFSIGYASYPFAELEKHLIPRDGESWPRLEWEKENERIVALYMDGREVAVYPYINV
jgi:hypothetical protein